MKLYEILNFADIYPEIRDTKMPFKTTYKLTMLSKKIEENANFYRDELQKLLKECAELDENGEIKFNENGDVTILEDKREEFNQKWTELQNVDVEVEDKLMFNVDELDGIEFSLRSTQMIMPFIKE